MRIKKNIDDKIYSLLDLSENSKIYYSNIWFIIISDKLDYVYKIFDKKEFYDKELHVYNFFIDKKDILVPNFEDKWKILSYYVLKLENIRKFFERKNDILNLDIIQIAKILSKIHSINNNWKVLILWDIHSSNFFEILEWNKIRLWIFDFSSSKYWDREEDIANFYIDIWINNNILNKFLDVYNYQIDFDKLYKYTVNELYERIKNWMNLSIEKRKMYYEFLIKLKSKLWKLKHLD